MKKSFLTLTLLILALNFSYAQNDGAGNTGLSFLKLGVTSRAISLGEAVVSNTTDASSTHYNPAAMFQGPKVNALFMHNEQILGIRTEFLSAKVSMEKFAFGLSLNNTSIDEIEVREITGEPLDKFTAQDFALGLSAAYKVNEKLTFGVTGKFIYEKIYIDNASGYAMDIGGLYNDVKNNFSIGASLSNWGSMNELRTEATKLPTAVRFGGAYFISIKSISETGVVVAVDGFKVLDGGKFHANAGAEFQYKDFLFVRAGYQTGFEDKGLTTGIGLKYKGFSLDYAFVPYKFSLGNSHTFTLGTSF
ncbi:MAG: PorV/PorQ family protein [Ignavibacteriae bacterium]|nr:MAG: PorV/PorQ family protein [Ignavibacteriota bacterium]